MGDINAMMNSFLNIYLMIFHSIFPPKRVRSRNNNDNNNWNTLSIKTSCTHKRELYITYRNSNNLELERHYQVYCKILSNIIKEAKIINYNAKILKSSNKCKSKHLKDQQDIGDAFSNYFSSIFDKISKNNIDNKISDENLSTCQYYVEQNYVHPSSSLVFKTFSTKESTSIIKMLKTNNSHGYDEISTELLKISVMYIHHQLISVISLPCQEFFLII